MTKAKRCASPQIKLSKSVVTAVSRQNGDEARLWAAALCVSVLLNILILTWVSYAVITAQSKKPKAVPQATPSEQIITIFPEMIVPAPALPEEKKQDSEVVRTSPDQESAEPPASRRYIGERNTTATSDTAPDPNAIEMPAQAGRVPKENEQLETTESDYQDGSLTSENDPTLPTPPLPTPTAQQSPLEPAPDTIKGTTNPDPGDAEKPETAMREKLIDGPNPVATPVKKAEVLPEIKPREEQKMRDGNPEGLAEEEPKEKPKETARPQPQPIDDPAFRGNQSKTKIQGNITRTGRSALDVADTPMGRYQAQISRAVELEWQRNCVKHQDFITPGYLTVRFYVLADGTVKNVNFVGDNQTGEIQKGFTLNSIRDAEIPPMPPAVKKEMDGDSLELLFNFYF